MFRAGAAILFFAASLCGQTIEGTVANSITGAPLGDVEVTVKAGGKSAGSTVTDGQGAFRFDGLAPGEYSLDFNRKGFDSPVRTDPVLRPFRLGSGTVRVDWKLTPRAKLSGRVLDAAGRPASEVRVWLLGDREGYDTASDAQGRFSFENVLPGSYRMVAVPPKSLKPPPPRKDQRMGWLTTFYPEAPDANSALRIVAAAGAELWDRDIRLLAAPVHRIGGVVLDAAGRPAPRIRVQLNSTRDVLFPKEDHTTTTIAAGDGSFEFPTVVDGEWRLTVEAENLRAFVLVALSGHDAASLHLQLQPSFTIHGTIVRDQTGLAKPPKAVPVVIAPAGGGPMWQAEPDGEDRFRINRVDAGLYTFQPISPPAPFYVASIQLGDRDVLGSDPVEVSSGALPMTVTYRSDGGTVRGTVQDCGSATVVLVPQERRLQTFRLMRSTTCAGDRYEIANVRPGEYYGYAFDRAPGVEDMFFGFNLDQGLINQAVRVTVRPSETTSADLRVTVRP